MNYQTILCLGLLGTACTSGEAGPPPKAAADFVAASNDPVADAKPPEPAVVEKEPPASTATVIPTIAMCLLEDDAGTLPSLTPLAQQTCPSSPRLPALVATEIRGLESLLRSCTKLDHDRPVILFRLAKAYAEWECSAHVLCARFPGTGHRYTDQDYRRAASRTIRHIDELCAMLRTDHPRFAQQCP